MKTPFKEILASDRFIVTAEIGPPKSTDLHEMTEHIDLLKDRVDGLNVTDNQSSVMRYPSLGTCIIIKERGGEPILQMTCRDRNRMALESDLLFAYSRGIRNVLVLTGDAVAVGDHKEAKAVFDLDSVQFIKMIRSMEAGRDLGGNELKGEFSFCVGAIVTPEADPIEPQLLKFKKKLAAGAEFIQTQAIYDLDKFKRFMDIARGFKYQAKILAGIVLLTSAGMAKYMNENVPGVMVPQGFIDELKSAQKDDRLKKGIEIASRLIRTIREGKLCDGVHIMAIGKEDVVPKILEESGL
ncbi:MAG: 5,10-methylenetetrahydrofolate reductase [Omnitrophica bacterium RBG_13_46_9]|nr:MAG: 5,10-methylenetetrahydrofolate reductase [Omnitrophica bacterium RBG_13_46_9]